MSEPRSNSSEVENREAAYFALCLLMPRQMVEAEVRKRGGVDVGDRKAMRELASLFGVEPTLMAYRLGQLGAR